MTLDQRDGSAGLRSLRGAVGATLAFTMVALIALGVGWAVLFQRTSKSSAVRDAGQYGSLSGQAALAPFITDDLLAGNTEAIEKISTAGRALMTLGGAAHVKIWTVDGRVVWSDEAELIGRTFTFDEAEQRVLKGNGVLASISNLDDEENKFEIASGEKELLQVYFGTKTPTGTPVVVETYYPTNLINARAADQRRSFLPLLLGGLVLVVIAQVPLARTMNRRLKTLQTEREHLLERVITASDLERRRIAAEVHDGAVQELIGITFSLSAAADEAPPTMAERLNGLAIATRHTVRSLRSLLNSIYPVEVPEVGWAAGLDPIISALRRARRDGEREGTRSSIVARQRVALASRRPGGTPQCRCPRPGFAGHHLDDQVRKCSEAVDRRQRSWLRQGNGRVATTGGPSRPATPA